MMADRPGPPVIALLFGVLLVSFGSAWLVDNLPGIQDQKLADWERRLAKHEVQLGACERAGGVPYFDSMDLFERCDLPCEGEYGTPPKD